MLSTVIFQVSPTSQIVNVSAWSIGSACAERYFCLREVYLIL
jgi:hypothetical protein